MDEQRWHVHDPEQTLREIDQFCPFELDRVIVAAVELETQRVTDARVAASGPAPTDDCGGDLVRQLAEAMVPQRWAQGPEGHGMTHVLVTVVCRRGRVVFTARESRWLGAWRRSNHGRGAFQGDVYIVTPDGWGGALDYRAGFEPALPRPIDAPQWLSSL